MKLRLLAAAVLVLAGLVVWYYRQSLRPESLPSKPRTIEEVVSALGPRVERRLRSAFEWAGLSLPPRKLTLLALKEEKRLEVYADGEDGTSRFILSYPILAASGTAGPKLREGDRQVPEGFYRIELLNPNSRYHLSLRVNYPNVSDIERARADGRELSSLGGDIMIHGGAESIGCLAIGDPAIEELFVLVARTGLDKVRLIIAPRDLRQRAIAAFGVNGPPWTAELHDQLSREIASLRAVKHLEGGRGSD
jgi:L,D-transpeptidase catalytic domain